MCISIIFSVMIHRVLVGEVRRFERMQRFRIERRFHSLSSITNPELVKETEQRILMILIMINVGIFLVSGGLGYVLAGRTLKPIKEMVEEQNRFISDASHELRTPLTSLKTSFEVYLRNKNQTLPEAKTLMTESIKEVNTLQSLSESLLQLTYYQDTDGQVKFKKNPVKDIIQEAIHKVEPLAKQKKIAVKYDSTNLQIKWDKSTLIDCVVILLNNAIKYSPRGTIIAIKTKKIDHAVTISVIDQGIGISQKDLPRIFDRFYRADSARTKKYAGGYGLGLSIAKKIVDMHKGSIRVESSLGKGSVFTLQLPFDQSA